MGKKFSATIVISFVFLQGFAGLLAYLGQTLAGFVISLSAVVGTVIAYLWYRNHTKRLEPITSANVVEPNKRHRKSLNMLLWVFPIITLAVVQYYIFSLYSQMERERHRPNMAVTQTMIGRSIGDNNSVEFRIEISLTNKGDKPAYELRDREVIAAIEMPQEAKLVGDKEVSGPVDIGETIIIQIEFTVASADGSIKPLSKGIALYWDLQYTDSLKQQARVFHNKQWVLIGEENYSRLAYLPQGDKEEFEVFVVKLLGKN